MMFMVLAIVCTLVFITQGWTVDLKDGAKQTGLVQFASNPTGAVVEIDQNTLYTKTNTKANVLPGIHDFNVWREGYETWYKKKEVSSGQLLWFNYIRLVPKEKQVKKFLEFNDLKQTIAFPNQQKILALDMDNGKKPEISVIDIRDNTPKQKKLSLSLELFDLNEEETNNHGLLSDQFEITAIAKNNNQAILKRTAKDKTEWVLLNLEKMDTSENLTREFNIQFSDLKFISDDGSRIISNSAGNLRTLNTRDKTMSATISKNVTDFSTYKNDVVSFTRKDDNSEKYSVGIYRVGDKKTVSFKTEYSSAVKTAVARYYNEDYLHVQDGKKINIHKANDWPAKNGEEFEKPKVINLSFKPENIELNSEGRLLAVSNKENTLVHDLELNESHQLDLKSTSKNANWLDDFIIYDFENNKLTIRDFDGANKQTLAAADPKFSAMVNSSNKFIYSITENKSGKYELSQLKMILN